MTKPEAPVQQKKKPVTSIYREPLPELVPIAVDKHRACKMFDICERTFDEYFRDVPKMKIGRGTRYLISDLVAKAESLRVEAETTE